MVHVCLSPSFPICVSSLVLSRTPASPASDVMAQEALDHRIHLSGHLKLVEVASTDSPAMDDSRQPFRHEMRRIEWRRSRQVYGQWDGFEGLRYMLVSRSTRYHR